MKRKVMALFPVPEVRLPISSPSVPPPVTLPRPIVQAEPPVWRRNEHPEYVRKIHYTHATRPQCPNRAKGRPQLTDDPAQVTCLLCKDVIRGVKRGTVTQLSKPESPKGPPPAA